ncbi:unnamed protein product [Ascophyllum nodosum]
MVGVKNIKCRTEGCGNRPSYGVAGTKTAEYCAQHAPDGMIDVRNRKCRTKGCGKHPWYGVADTKTEEYCAQHAPDGMVAVKSRQCKTEGCVKGQSFGVAGTKTGEYCTQNAPNGMVDACSRKCRRLAHTIPGRKPLVTKIRTTLNIKPFILLPLQALLQKVARTRVSEYVTQKLHLRPRCDLSHESWLEERRLCRILSGKHLLSNESLP